MSALQALMAELWAIDEASLSKMIEIAERANDKSPEALEKYRAESMRRAERAKVREGVAILYAEGPLFKRANLFTEMSGATSYDVLMRDLALAVDTPDIKGIALYLDTPGGEVSGCDELGEAIFQARQKKPIEAYASGTCASAGYWLGSAASKLTISEATEVGSIGAVLTIQDYRPREEARGVKNYKFISAVSPNKQPDPSTEQGSNSLQTRINDLGELFVKTVSRNRGVSVEDVLAKFGGGGVEMGAKAVSLGMADAVGQFEDVIASLSKSGSRRSQPLNNGGFQMSDPTGGKPAISEEDLVKAKAEAKAAERARVTAITGHDVARSRPALASLLAGEDNVSAEFAAKVFEAIKAEDPKAEPVTAPTAPEAAETAYLQRNSASASLGAPSNGTTPENPLMAAVDRINKAA